jgi:hypothetical protein
MVQVSEGTLFIVNKIFIEALVLSLFIFLKNRGWGIQRLRDYLRDKSRGEQTDPVSSGTNNGRRELIQNLSTLPLIGVLGIGAFQSRRNYDIDTTSGATIQVRKTALSELEGELPKGMIGFPSYPVLKKYQDITGSKIQVISQVAPDLEKNDYFVNINTAIDHGVDIIQVQGNWTDVCVRDGKIDVIGKMMDYIRKQAITAGFGAHSVDAHIVCEEAGIIPDYYMTTMHHDNYWSAHPKENREVFEVMNGRSAMGRITYV